MGCLKILHSEQKSALSKNWKIFVGGVEKSVSSKKNRINYYPFGMQQPGRTFDSPSYRYGFQGQEKDDEVKGSGNSLNYKFRMHDPRIGRFLSLDPISSNFPWNSPYAFSENRVVDGVEFEGLEFVYTANGTFLGKIGDKSNILIQTETQVARVVSETTEFGIMNLKIVYDESTSLIQFSSGSQAARNNILRTIYSKLNGSPKVGLMHKELNSAMGMCDCDGYGNNYRGGSSPTIKVDEDITGQYGIESVLLKETIHLSDHNKDNTQYYDFIAHSGIINTKSWKNSSDGFKREFLESAAEFMWAYMGAIADSEGEVKEGYNNVLNSELAKYKKAGITFDFSSLKNANEFMGGGHTLFNAESVKISIDGKDI